MNNKNIEELKNKIKDISKGTVVKKNIKGKNYFYYQYYSLGDTKSFYIPEKYVEEVKVELSIYSNKKKKENEDINSIRNLASLSKNARELTGQIMMEDIPVASFIKGELTWIDENLCPLLIKRTHNVTLFLSTRAIDTGRTNAKLLKKVLNIKDTDDYLISQYSYGATITDNYWFKPLYSKLKFKDITFNNDFYGGLALNGSFNALPKYSKHTPQLTLGGSFEKCWRKEDGIWWLYKKGTKENNFAELYVYELSKKLNIMTAEYRYSKGNIKTKNFANKYNFEPMISIAGEDDRYENVFEALSPYSKKIKQDYLKLIFLDTLVFNVDRHNENMGLLRDKTNGKVISLAPNFDNNLALNANGKSLMSFTDEDSLIKLFVNFLSKNKKAKKLFDEIKIKEINKEMLIECYKKVETEEKPIEVVDFLLARYKYIKKKLDKLSSHNVP